MEFLKANAGTIVTGFIVFAVLALVVARLVINFRKGKTACGCGCCPGCCPGQQPPAATQVPPDRKAFPDTRS